MSTGSLGGSDRERGDGRKARAAGVVSTHPGGCSVTHQLPGDKHQNVMDTADMCPLGTGRECRAQPFSRCHLGLPANSRLSAWGRRPGECEGCPLPTARPCPLRTQRRPPGERPTVGEGVSGSERPDIYRVQAGPSAPELCGKGAGPGGCIC